MCGRDLLRLPGVNPGQHCNGLQTATHLTDGQKVLKNQSLAAEAFHPPLQLYLRTPPLSPSIFQINPGISIYDNAFN